MKNSLTTQSNSQLFLGGPVLFQSLFIFAILFATLNVSAAPKKKYLNPQVQRIKLSQENLKKAHQLNKSLYLKKGFESQETRVLNQCHGKSGMACRIEKASSSASFKYKTGSQKVSSFFSQIKAWFSSFWFSIKDGFRNVARSTKMTKNNLPTAGGIAFAVESSGVHGKYRFSSIEALGDSDGEVVSVTWDFDDGSSMDIPVDELDDHATIAHVFPGTGTYDVTLRVYDNEGEYAEFSEEITVSNNSVPTPDFTATQDTGNIFDFVATANDPENSVESYSWFFGDESTPESGPTLSTISHEFPAPGEYEVAVLVRDTNGGEAWRTKKVYVDISTPSTAVPTAIVKMNTVFGEGPLEVEFDGSLSVTHAGTAVTSYHWDFGDFDDIDNTSTVTNPAHTYTRPGTYYGRLKVLDVNNNSNEFYFTVYVSSSNIVAPFIMAEPNEESRGVTFNQHHVSRVNLTQWESYFWEFGDNSKMQGASSSHTYAVDGVYPIRLVVHDLRGIRYVVNKDIQVNLENEKPQIDLYAEKVSQQVDSSYGYAVQNTSQSSENESLNYLWSFGDGTIISGEQLSEASHVFENRGLYNVSVIATNAKGISSIVSKEVFAQEGSVLESRMIYTPRVGSAPLAVEINGAWSTGIPAAVTKRILVFSDGSRSDDYYITKTFTEPGTYWVKLYTEDSLGHKAFDVHELIVSDGSIPGGNHTPIAKVSSENVDANSAHILLKADESTDIDNDHLLYEWKIDGGAVRYGNQLDLHLTPGRYIIELKVIDKWGVASTITKKIDIANDFDVVPDIISSPSTPLAREITYFGALDSIIPGVIDPQIKWDFGDGNFAYGLTASHIYAAPGMYTAKLSVKNYNGQVFNITKNIEVIDAGSLEEHGIQLLAAEANGGGEASNNETLTSRGFPYTVNFSAEDQNPLGPLSNIVWDFGDGSIGFGANANYTYRKPGVYTVEVSAQDFSGQTITATAQVDVTPETSCIVDDETDQCLVLLNSVGNVLPYSQSTWRFSMGDEFGNLSSSTANLPEEWITLEETDSTEVNPPKIDLSDVAVISGNEIQLAKSDAITKGINPEHSYKLVITVENTNGDVGSAMWPNIHFGNSSLSISTLEDNVNLIITNSESLYQKYIQLGTSNSLSITDLPPGNYIVRAINSLNERSYSFVIDSSDTYSLEVDMEAERKSNKSFFAPNEEKIVYPYPTPTGLGWCGQPMPFTKEFIPKWAPEGYTLSYGLGYWANNFWSLNKIPYTYEWLDTSEQIALSTGGPTVIPKEFGDTIRVRCEVYSLSFMDALSKWYNLESWKSCQEPWNQHYYDLAEDYYWNTLVRDQKPVDNHPFEYEMTIKDRLTSKTRKGKFTFTINQIMQEQGITKENAPYELGFQTTYIGQLAPVLYKNFYFKIPPEFGSSEMTVKFKGKYNATIPFGPQRAAAYCEILKPTTNDMVADDLIKSHHAQDKGSQIWKNSAAAIDDNVFPVQYESDLKEVYRLGADVYKAKFDVRVKRKGKTTSWSNVYVEYLYGGATADQSTIFATSESTALTVKKEGDYYYIPFEVNLEQFKGPNGIGSPNWPAWQKEKEKMWLRITPISTDPTVEVVPAVISFTALFNARDAINNYDNKPICSAWYSTDRISAYASDSLLSFLHNKTEHLAPIAGPILCNDMSHPFGAQLVWPAHGSTYKRVPHYEHKMGNVADLRYFNSSETAANSYDGSFAQSRRNDVDAYISFAQKAVGIINHGIPGSTLCNDTVYVNSLKKAAFESYCGAQTDESFQECNSNANVTAVSIIKACMWEHNVTYTCDGVKSACEGVPLASMRKYAEWINRNYLGFKDIIGSGLVKKIAYSAGKHLAAANPVDDVNTTPATDWQRDGLFRGMWPADTGLNLPQVAIFKSDGTNILTGYANPCYVAPVNNCNSEYGKVTVGEPKGHLNHFHLEVK